MIKLLDIDQLQAHDIEQIWRHVTVTTAPALTGNVAWSFEGNGIRTRTTFLQAFQTLGLSYIELPNFLKTDESVVDLAGYMDGFYDVYVIRERNHSRLVEFAAATKRPLINAMSSEAHPCEVLTDAYYLSTRFTSLPDVRILLWGPMTNVFKSWHVLARVMGLNVTHYCPETYQTNEAPVRFVSQFSGHYDVLITDAWPSGFTDDRYALTKNTLAELGDPLLLPTPPVTVGNELAQPLSEYPGFVGYAQKQLLLPVQRAIITYLLS